MRKIEQFLRRLFGDLHLEYSELKEDCPEVIKNVNTDTEEYLKEISLAYRDWWMQLCTAERAKLYDFNKAYDKSWEAFVKEYKLKKEE